MIIEECYSTELSRELQMGGLIGLYNVRAVNSHSTSNLDETRGEPPDGAENTCLDILVICRFQRWFRSY